MNRLIRLFKYESLFMCVYIFYAHNLDQKSSQPHYGPRVYSASNRNECQESSWG
jgi:hypothetical protein